LRPVIHSQKHYVQESLATIVGGAKRDIVIAKAVEGTVANLVNEVIEGSVIKAVYVEMWLRSAEAAAATQISTLTKVVGGGSTFSVAQMAALGTAANKKNILYTTQGLVNDVDADAVFILKGWIKIPKSKQRFGLDDQLILQIFAQGTIDLHICGFFTYKEYT